MGLVEEDVHSNLLVMKMQLLDLQEKVEVLIRWVEEGHNGPNKMGQGNERGMGNEDGPGSKQINLVQTKLTWVK